jgi:hypothetical protein
VFAKLCQSNTRKEKDMRKAVLTVCALAVMLVSNCGGIFGKYEIVYKAWGSASDVKLRYWDSGENEIIKYGYDPPFNYSFRTGRGEQTLELSVTKEDAAIGSEAYVEIWVNGVRLGEGHGYVGQYTGDFLLAQTGIIWPSDGE